ALVHGTEDVAGVAHVGRRDELEELRRRDVARRSANLIVVRRALGERLLEDRGIRRHPREGVVANPALQLTIAQQLALDEVEPDRDAGVMEQLERIGG